MNTLPTFIQDMRALFISISNSPGLMEGVSSARSTENNRVVRKREAIAPQVSVALELWNGYGDGLISEAGDIIPE